MVGGWGGGGVWEPEKLKKGWKYGAGAGLLKRETGTIILGEKVILRCLKMNMKIYHKLR